MEVQSHQTLEAVPLDVITEIGKHLDIKSVTRFGSTKRNYRKFLIDSENPQKIDLYRTIYSYQYDNNNHINYDSKVDWAQLCRLHCYNRLQEPSYEEASTPNLTLSIDYLTNKVTYESKCGGGSDSYRAVAAEMPLLPLFCGGAVGYYEITTTADWGNEGYTNFGLTENGVVAKGRAVGWYADHFWCGYHGDDGNVFDSKSHAYTGFHYGTRWMSTKRTATVGCLINFRNNQIAFTVDGVCLHEVNLNLSSETVRRLHPVIGTRENLVTEFNFGGKPFEFDINKYDLFGSSEFVDGIFTDDD
eukprot:TRINITY_DN12589_c0_g1_i1.p1 TRINITY_DN12589_c0_g1~~TRINITY_DN12589_c0_g1_i1.p1  ORF type:complete len:302 (-),score=21.21 TRINITY_DN12589_c0_g1_i1:33-938(-)